MNKRIIATGIGILMGILLFSTNPDETRFKAYLKGNLEQKAAREGEVSKAVMNVLSGPAAAIMNATADRQNLLLFSVYKISLPDENRKYVGALNQFVRIS